MNWLKTLWRLLLLLVGAPLFVPVLAAGLLALWMGATAQIPEPIAAIHPGVYALLLELVATAEEMFRVLCVAVGLGLSLTGYYAIYGLFERAWRQLRPPEGADEEGPAWVYRKY